ncbi:DUF1350 domain-containing protein [Synechococcales cyanobacterium C]|uniref:DUF1350 domain-containing protein n=1 Tax=Petrachloros mirabilis ULC683 TaxID=2781853 RepID=A0A8K2A1E4_9CYAN|nr:DUF1350 family protein [Petrachloros mirabilis]NCJ07871.1 DUF1350 domain-containing protein [Petrachloros mirabilis ULC683]
MIWREVAGNWVLVPQHPVAIIHFLGGAFVATAPQATYRRFLESLAREGYLIIASPFLNTLDHEAIAASVLRGFERAHRQLEINLRLSSALPIYGIGHSMGCKLHLLIGSTFKVERAGHILMAFNNYAADRAIPFVDLLDKTIPVEFRPTPAETLQIIQQYYQVRRNLLVQFANDSIDQTRQLATVLGERFPGMVAVQRLAGNHLTPLGTDVRWQSGDAFSPLDALGQWVRQTVYRDLASLEGTILQWLNPC